MRNIKIYEKYEDFLAAQEAASGSGKYVEDIVPGFSYVKELFFENKQFAYYNPTEKDTGEYQYGDLIYYDGTDTLKSVYWSSYTPDMGEKVGLVVVPSSMAPDGNARILAFGVPEITGGVVAGASETENKKGGETVLKAGSTINPDYFGFSTMFLDGEQNYFASPALYGVMGSTSPIAEGGEQNLAKGDSNYSVDYTPGVSYMSSNGNLYYSMSSDLNRDDYAHQNIIENENAPGENWSTGSFALGGGRVCVSPNKNDETVNTEYTQEEYTTKGVLMNAFSDFSGLTWTKMMHIGSPEVIKETGGGETTFKSGLGSSPYQAAQNYYCLGTQEGDWYVPAAGELGFVAARYWDLYKIYVSLSALEDEPKDPTPIFFPSLSYSNYSNQIISSTMVHDDNEAGCPPCLPFTLTTNFTWVDGGDTGGDFGPMRADKIEISPIDIYNMISERGIYGSAFCTLDTRNSNYVLPMAMIKGGKIVTTVGTPKQNGWQVKDISNCYDQ